MFKHRLDITGTLKVLSSLHLGSGEDKRYVLPKGGGKRRTALEGEESVRIALVARDHLCRPCLPGTSIKGVLRRLAEAEELWGTAHDDTGKMGRLVVRMAPHLCAPPAGEMEPLPWGDATSGLFVEARTRIDRALGTAQDGLLYHAEMVAPGNCFQLRLSLLEPDKALETQVMDCLSRLTAEDGIAFGRGQTAGLGRVRLDGPLTLTRVQLGKAGESETFTVDPTSSEVRTRLVLHCTGPYLSVDASRTVRNPPPTEEVADNSPDKQPQLQPLMDGQKRPALRGSALMGVLRSRAAWLEALEGWGDDPDKRFTTVEDLTPAERLFGVTGFRGLLQLRRVVTEPGYREVKLTSVALDQFSMAPIDNALFTTGAFVNCTFWTEFDLDRRAKDGDIALWERLVQDARDNGLMLGHGGNKGFGWFTVAKEESRGEKSA